MRNVDPNGTMSTFFPSQYNPLKQSYWFGQADGRPIAIFRVLFGLVLLKHALYHVPIAGALFSDSGIFPRWVLYQGLVRPDRVSILDSLGADWSVTLFFAAWAVIAICLTAGYRSSLMAILNFIFILSVHERNPWLLNAADTILRVISFWILFIPLGQSYSVDAVLRRWHSFQSSGRLAVLQVPGNASTVFAFPLRVLQLQIGLIYVFTAVLKIPGDQWRNGNAIYQTLQLQTSTLPTADWLFAVSPLWVLQVLNYFSLFAEWGFFPLVFSPFGQPAFRILGLALGAAFHTGIAALMSVPNFLVLVFSYVLFFEGAWIGTIDTRLRKTRGASTVPPAQGRLTLLPVLAVTRSSELTLAQTPAERYEHFDSWWIEDESGRRYVGAPAWGRLAGHMPLSRLWWWITGSRFVRRAVWSALCRLASANVADTAPELAQPAISGAARATGWHGWYRAIPRATLAIGLASLLAVVVWWNLGGVSKPGSGRLVGAVPKEPAAAVQYLGLWQQWGMYSPDPPTSFGNIVIPGTFEDGTSLDLVDGEPLSHEWRRGMWGPTARVKLFEEWMSYGNKTPVFQAWSAKLCRDYNDGSRPEGARLASFDFRWRYQVSHPPRGAESPVLEIQRWHHWCFPQYAPGAGS